MHIWIGTTNKAKVSSVQSVFTDAHLYPKRVPTGVSEQPFSDEETKQGAIFRAKEVLPRVATPDALGIGLEGGVMEIGETLYICNWGALVTHTGEIYVASGARIPLPDEISVQLRVGKELGPVMEAFAKKEDVRHNEGAVGIFTNGKLHRSAMFSHIVLMLKGQWEFAQNTT